MLPFTARSNLKSAIRTLSPLIGNGRSTPSLCNRFVTAWSSRESESQQIDENNIDPSVKSMSTSIPNVTTINEHSAPASKEKFSLTTKEKYLVDILNSKVYEAARETELQYAENLSAHIGNDVYLKREDTQPVFFIQNPRSLQ